MKRNMLIIVGHPDTESFCTALSEAYMKGALSDINVNVERIEIGKLIFDPNLKFGYRKRVELEDDLMNAQQLISWAHHLVFVYPTWWGTMPAILKGFIDRIFLPGFAFKYRENSIQWDKLLKGKSAHLIVTMDTPSWYNKWIYRHAGHKVMKKNILEFCGISPIRVTEIGPVKDSSMKDRTKWLDQAKQLGALGR
ncbi:NAD(P)H-dependent oxidoreductase [Metabacillus litoralis]|uniref:NAD(P)H-dependent oxidoreductase n=1 Tax=Metabacillus litoralis TaxID=152268 RepID=A0A5C6V555_9BACI|nr:NAD(P)H-dependent oxidoreductase [Metabacillus litoralis]TXC78725.1 NAD(P)H-dependent oxidoreductase [Metabacillus litoralis]